MEKSRLESLQIVLKHIDNNVNDDIMGMLQRVNMMKANGILGIIGSPDIIYIYKLTSVHTGHFYIGQTSSLKDRMYSHLSTIIKVIEGADCKRLKFHSIIAVKIKELHNSDKRIKIEKFTRDSLSVYAMAMVADKESANILERHYIKKYINDPMCININL